MTRLALQSYESWEETPFEPIEKALPALKVPLVAAPATTREAFAGQLGIHGDKVRWDWQPPSVEGKTPNALEVLVESVSEPDDGMDQNLDLGPDQKYMGGYQGLSSQGIRHMYYRGWDPLSPLITFHIPLHEMGLAPERAAVYFDLARQAQLGGHPFWAYRFLGWGLHYIQDLGQPFHTVQFASFRLLPLRVLLTVGWEPFVAETQRLVGNYHLAFERYTDHLLASDAAGSEVAMSFKVPKGDEDLKQLLEQKGGALTARQAALRLARASEELASGIVAGEDEVFGELLNDPKLVLADGFYDAQNKPKVDFAASDRAGGHTEARKKLLDGIEQALSNTGVATRWYVDKLRVGESEGK